MSTPLTFSASNVSTITVLTLGLCPETEVSTTRKVKYCDKNGLRCTLHDTCLYIVLTTHQQPLLIHPKYSFLRPPRLILLFFVDLKKSSLWKRFSIRSRLLLLAIDTDRSVWSIKPT